MGAGGGDDAGDPVGFDQQAFDGGVVEENDAGVGGQGGEALGEEVGVAGFVAGEF